MTSIIKKILYCLILNFICVIQTFAGTISVNAYNAPTVFSNKILQTVNVSIVANKFWRLTVYPISKQIDNQSNSNYSLPLSRLELTDAGGNPMVTFGGGKVGNYDSYKTNGLNNFNLNFNITTSENDRPGSYLIGLEFILFDSQGHQSEAYFPLRFQKEEIAFVDFSEQVTHLQLDKDKILQKGVTQDLVTPLSVYVKSNKNWKLYIKRATVLPNSKVTYYTKPLSADNSITLNNTDIYTKMDNNTYLIARGSATFNNFTNTLDKKIINMDYMVKGPEDDFLQVGSESNDFQYILETED